jgi:hypothetical protein
VHSDPAAGRGPMRQAFEKWRAEPDLADVRDPDALDKLPTTEREEWRKLWGDLDARLAQIPAPK